ncbi:MAG TPA: hypothetical protein VG711_01580 [Phycisphaerales bacterium]|nr:hypothetical protein [Phycisphaerales bacterium]
MRLDVKDMQRRYVGRVEVDEQQRPTIVTTVDSGKEVFLNWDAVLDDAGQVRKCVVCGCSELYEDKAFPQITGIVVVLAFVGAVIGILQLATNLPILISMGVVLVLDIAILFLSRRRLVCYVCGTTYSRAPIARYHRRWERTVAERYARARMAEAGIGTMSDMNAKREEPRSAAWGSMLNMLRRKPTS